MKKIPVFIVQRAQKNPRRVPKYGARVMRIKDTATVPNTQLLHSDVSCKSFAEIFEDQGIEGLYALHLNQKSRLIGATIIPNDILFDPIARVQQVTYREIFRNAIALNSSTAVYVRFQGDFSAILGNIDVTIATKVLSELSQMIGIFYLDYLVAGFGTDGKMHCVSFAERMPSALRSSGY